MLDFMAYYTKKPELFDAWGIPRYYGGHIKIKPVNCKKPQCRRCPHKYYAYHVSGWGALHNEVYLGTAEVTGAPRHPYGNKDIPVKKIDLSKIRH